MLVLENILCVFLLLLFVILFIYCVFNFIVCSGMFDDHQDTYVTNRMFYVKNSNKHQTILQGCMNKVTFYNDG